MSRPAFAMRVHRARRRLAAHLREQDADFAALTDPEGATPVAAAAAARLAPRPGGPLGRAAPRARRSARARRTAAAPRPRRPAPPLIPPRSPSHA